MVTTRHHTGYNTDDLLRDTAEEDEDENAEEFEQYFDN